MRLQIVQDALKTKKSGFYVPRTEIPCVGISRWSLGCRDKYL